VPHFAKAIFATLAFLSLSAADASTWSQEEALGKLYYPPAPPVASPARHTFVFWVNGDADHFQPQSSAPEAGSEIHRIDKHEVRRIEEIARSCRRCNVVVLHDQRGNSSAWYMRAKPWATYLRVYARGKKIAERHVPEIDGTDPRALAWLLRFSEQAFPESELHLIYRGHAFRTPYLPGAPGGALPFDYSHPERAYGQATFLRSLEMANLRRKLASVTLASCSMASIELASRLERFAAYFVASKHDVLEVLDVGFRFDSILAARDKLGARAVSWRIALSLLGAFDDAPSSQDAMLEYPATWVDLSGMSAISARFDALAAMIDALPEARKHELRAALIRRAGLTKGASSRYLRMLRAQGKPDAAVRAMERALRVPSERAGDLDLDRALDLVAALPSAGDTRAAAALSREIKTLISVYIHRIGSSAGPGALTLTLAADGSLLPRLESSAHYSR
jgi:hypothetical protein